MNEALIRRASQVVDFHAAPFDGTLTEALDVMVEFVGSVQHEGGDTAQTRLTRMLRACDPDKVAEVCASALLRLAAGAV
ncbi:hypothetical protein ACFFX1_55505 [Dactylosporangium sucinum]|uniref:Uncharacterized protein n=1 Tax=Dactylosporangium sucinum TaxID=1424081 RepID=A0A917X1Z4_9ACTN|nr:hypothetical protein [Dactylosporangium sucinum]GGM52562.1 hypothetical protein GCM10007977_062630 [Dactylosporangium sucinum]